MFRVGSKLIHPINSKKLLPLQRAFSNSLPAWAVTPFNLADIGEGISEVELIQWFVKPGDKVEEFSKICEVQSDKAAVEISSRYEGTILKLYHNVGEIAKVGSPLVDIETEEEHADSVKTSDSPAVDDQPAAPKPPAADAAPASASAHKQSVQDALVYATPAVRRVAREHNVDISQVKGTGPQGRVLKGDVLAYVKAPPAAAADKIQNLTPIQKAMFKSMTKSLSIPHFGFSDEIVVNATSQFRRELNAHLSSLPKGTYSFDKVSYMPIFLKALSEALKQYPVLNAQLVNAETTPALLFRGSHNIGIAMDTPNGLVVPNVKDVQNKSIFEIASDLEALKVKGQKGSLGNADLQGGTITLSNIGNVGGTGLHPVLVTSEVCIGALGKVQRLPRFEMVDGVEKVVAKEILSVSFNADHRVIDGATVARFVQLWKTYLEKPSLLTANLK
ncbi:hypothetical protein HDV03_000502 [Kappamyces sp. JEL0829]|nr:hypothetical protein HDV03_000502 [Kappamyces sp. JEL0829]